MHTLGAYPGLTAEKLNRRTDLRWIAVYLMAGFVALFVIALHTRNPELGYALAAAVLIVGGLGIIVRPVVGIYLMVFLGLLSDNVSAPWWPFLKNGSSEESLLFIHSGVIASPMEGYLVLTAVSTIAHIAIRRVPWTRPPLGGPMALFAVFIAVGLFWGFSRGGNIPIGLWEVRPFFVLFIFYFMAASLIAKRSQARLLSWVILAALVIEPLRTIWWFIVTPDSHLFDSLVEHVSASHTNLLFVTVAFAWLVKKSGNVRRYAIPFLSIPALWVYLISERRSAIASLIVALIIVFVFLVAHNPARFFKVVPALVVGFAAYTVAFWNASGILGFPAEVIRSQISPETQSSADLASDAYRIIEHLDILATVQRTPLLGVGFGQQYDRPIPLPDISLGFIWWEYITHNAVLWIWLKTGFFGFVAMFNMIGRALQLGMRTALRTPEAVDKVIVGTATVYIPIYMVYSYVDISWTSESLILLAAVFAIISRYHILGKEAEEAEAQRSAEEQEQQRWRADKMALPRRSGARS